MKPAPFDYRAPRTEDEVLALLAEHGDEAKLVAGGQTLGPMLNMRLVTPALLVDLNRVESLAYRRPRGAGGLALGALTRQSDLEDDPGFAASQPLAAAAIPWIAHRPIRNRGTVAGSLAHADPAAEWGALALALDAELVLRRAGGEERTVPADEFFVALLTTALEPDELLAEVRLPAWPAAAGWSFLEVARRRGDFALSGVACRLGLDGAGRIADPRVALIGVADTPWRARAAERALAGEVPSEALFREAGRAGTAELACNADLHASAEYRRHLATVLIEDALAEAAGRAEGTGSGRGDG